MTKIAIDAGNFTIGSQVTSGIERILDNYLSHSIKTDDIENKLYSFNKNAPHALPQFAYSSFFLPLNVILDKPDVFLGFSTSIPKLLKNNPVKKILFVHDLGFITYPNKYRNPDQMSKMLKSSLSLADSIIVPSDYTAAELKRNFPHLKSHLIHRIYWGVDHLSQVKHKSPMRNPYFLYVGVIKPIKHIELLFHAFHTFCESTNNINCKLIVIGNKEKDYFNDLISLHEYQKIKDLIVFKDQVDDSILAEYYQNAIALLNFSFEEGFAFPPLEALSLGTPAIVSNLLLYNEYEKYVDGLFKGSSKEELSSLMIKMLTYKKGKKSLLRSNHPFLWERFTKELVNVFGRRANSLNF